MIGIVAYIVVFVFTFFDGSFMVARFNHEDPTDPLNFGMLVGTSLIWPITIPLITTIMLLFCVAKFAMRLSGGKE